MEHAIVIQDVTKRFRETVAVSHVTACFETGKIHGIIGRNGSGKTVLFKCICGLFPVTEGSIEVLGQRMGDGKRVPKGVGAIIETPGFLPNCSGYQNLRYLMELSGKVGVCLDTCHVWDGGYNIAGDLDGVLEEFDRVIGLDRLRAIHLNDSKNPLGAHKDRHAPIGEGCIGFDALAAVTNHPALRDLPFFLETPQDDLSGWGREIAALRAAHTE